MPSFSQSESTAVSHASYNAKRHQLYITFRGTGETYVYLGVPKHDYDALLAANSIGRFVSLRIKPRYKFQFLKNAS